MSRPGAHRYGERFYDWVDASSSRSARALLSRLDLGFAPASVLDVGCGRGAWLAEWKARGAREVLGVDGGSVDPARLLVGPGEFRVADLVRPLDLGRRFDLVECLEVAEHLPPAAEAVLVASLARHGDVVLFSAATPGQGGEHHVNERPLSHWVARFAEAGLDAHDAVRPAVAGEGAIEPWYRYNTLLFATAAGAARLSEAVRRTRLRPGEPPRELAPLAWRLRCAALRVLPRPAVDALARLKHRLRA